MTLNIILSQSEETHMFFGIDLTSTEANPSACLCLNAKLQIVFYGLLGADTEIAAAISLNSPQVVAIDAPLSLPLGLCCLEESCGCQSRNSWHGRLCEQELACRAAPCYFTTKKSIIRRMVYRGMALKDKVAQQGCKVIEVYPYASKVRLFGKPIPRKNMAKGRFWLREKLIALLKNRQPFLEQWNHDLCDAAIAAYTGFLYAHGKTEALGDVQEGLIYIPTNSCGRKEDG
ncbi:MAG: DUF429 domain-containing protein [Chloroflexi bacterium]|nr:DUF429 domain-containing protein [Chloroflexota bacterium]